jgi:hypothetical protein
MVGGSFMSDLAQMFFPVHRRKNSGGAENSAEKSGPHGENFFCYMSEFNLRHLVWVTV